MSFKISVLRYVHHNVTQSIGEPFDWLSACALCYVADQYLKTRRQVNGGNKKPALPQTRRSLLAAMENAGGMVKDGKIFGARGIGCDAGRKETISGLLEDGLVLMDKTTSFLTPTQKGMDYLKKIPQPLCSPIIRAHWEYVMGDVDAGIEDKKSALKELTAFLTGCLQIEPEPFVPPPDECNYCGGTLTKEIEGVKSVTVTSYHCLADCGFTLRSNDWIIHSRGGISSEDFRVLALNGAVKAEGGTYTHTKIEDGRKFKARVDFQPE